MSLNGASSRSCGPTASPKVGLMIVLWDLHYFLIALTSGCCGLRRVYLRAGVRGRIFPSYLGTPSSILPLSPLLGRSFSALDPSVPLSPLLSPWGPQGHTSCL